MNDNKMQMSATTTGAVTRGTVYRGDPPAAAGAPPQTARSAGRMISGARWFYWVAGLSLINTVIAIAGGHVRFVIGLGMTEIVDYIASHGSSGVSAVALIVNIMVAGMFFLFGNLAMKRSEPAFLIGMTIYVLDAAVLVMLQDWLSVAFHAYVAWRLYQGFAALKDLSPTQGTQPGGMLSRG